ncbi:unnamed protein product [Rotaria sordida]|uniref:Peptidase M12A domain-containing protein n=1 Tax=Rotaria sordida TaxID=392033 RepID=A0A815G2X2_9BILA|nr:unnamed protein product [Rotaria sordida]CAF4019062.1 unnamed protein product [Rotaria sordida]
MLIKIKFFLGPSQIAFIIRTMEKMEREIAINNVACIKFRPKLSTDQYYISFKDGDGCSSPVGQMRGEEMEHIVTLNYPGCFVDAIIMHELLHTLGNLSR